jgi:hypothetical protein
MAAVSVAATVYAIFTTSSIFAATVFAARCNAATIRGDECLCDISEMT